MRELIIGGVCLLIGVIAGVILHNVIMKRVTADVAKTQADIKATLGRIENALGLNNKTTMTVAAAPAVAAKSPTPPTP
jgi:uncharacterized membrane-anchored protein YhcB (DUF1043 family)